MFAARLRIRGDGTVFFSSQEGGRMTSKRRFCQVCQAEIPAERIDALPETRLCIRCSQKKGGDFVISMVPENLGKPGSLKKNYGGVHISKRRRRLEPE
jgi:hypothetical protein